MESDVLGSEPIAEGEAVDKVRAASERLVQELGQVIVGQSSVIEEIMIVLFSGRHCLITGAPGLAKTMLIRSLAQLLDLKFRRIQFTPDLMPSDITGTELIEEDQSGQRHLRFVPGPIFTNILLADEINRTPPKTQAALLEAMEEKQVTVAGTSRPLDDPFFVLATQNPIELEGTYPLPEAQLDRFMFNILIDYLGEEEELEVATRTTSTQHVELGNVMTGEDIKAAANMVRGVPVAEPIARYAVRLVQASRPDQPDAPEFVKNWVSWGAGTRASQNLILGAKARALLKGRYHVSIGDIKAVAHPVLRHRLLTNFRAEAEGIRSEDLVDKLLEHISPPTSNLD